MDESAAVPEPQTHEPPALQPGQAPADAQDGSATEGAGQADAPATGAPDEPPDWTPPPSLARIVHYVQDDHDCAAIITEVLADEAVHLCAFSPDGYPAGHRQGAVPHDEAAKSIGTWHWPERS